MANRNFNRKQALAKEVKEIYAEISIGASGAPTLVQPLGVASISRTSAGLYVLTLQDQYIRLMDAHVSIQSAAAQDLSAQIAAQAVNTSAKTITFRTVAGAVETDPSNGSVLRVALQLKNSSAK
jgi:hypothetical protein